MFLLIQHRKTIKVFVDPNNMFSFDPSPPQLPPLAALPDAFRMLVQTAKQKHVVAAFGPRYVVQFATYWQIVKKELAAY